MKVYFRNILKIVLAAALVATVVACVNYKKVRLTSVSIVSVSPAGLRSVDGVIRLGVENNSSEFTISDIEGTIYRAGAEVGLFSADPVTIRSGSATYNVPGKVSLSGGVSLIEMIDIAANFNIGDFTMDLTMKLKPKGGAVTKISRKNIPVNDFINTLKTRGV